MGERRPILQLEELGPRILPSVSPVPAAKPHYTVQVAALHQAATPGLSGQGQGNFTIDGAKYKEPSVLYHRLLGTADLAGLGRVDVRGEVHSFPFMYHGRVWGNLTFSNAHGSLTMQLHSSEQYVRPAQQFTYTIVGGTGAYARLSGHGSLNLTLTSTPMGEGRTLLGTFTFAV